jgi:sortase (surface protein transpeptidase)
MGIEVGTALLISAAVSTAGAVMQQKEAKKTRQAQEEAARRAEQQQAQAEEDAQKRQRQSALDQQTSERATVDYGAQRDTEFQDSTDLLIPKDNVNLGTGTSTRTGIGF